MTGPLTRDDLMALLKAVMPEAYLEPLLANPENLLVLEAMAEVFARASQSVDTNTQAMFLLPWSGQTAPPAEGEGFATTVLELRRTGRLDQALPIIGGSAFQHWLNDWSPTGPVLVTTERRYVATHSVAFAPGDAGPILVEVRAELPGYGYNAPGPGSISRIVQKGAGLGNTGASVIAGVSGFELRASELPDVPGIANVGAMVLFTYGANTGRVANVIGYGGPIPGASGGSLYLVADAVLVLSGIAGVFEDGEVVSQTTGTGATGVLLTQQGGYAVVRPLQGDFVPGNFTGATSGATATVASVDVAAGLTPEVGTATWQVLSFEEAYGLEVTNPAQPTGGRSAMLDELGNERDIQRADPLETDDAYRKRVSKPIDVVSPNAVRRAGNSALKPFCLSICLREVGTEKFPGLFFDEDFFDYGRVYFGLVGGGVGFQEREWVHQDIGGYQTRGRISVTVDNTGTTFRGVDYVTGPGFVPGPLVGETSGTTDTITGPVTGDQNEYRFRVLLSLDTQHGFFLVGVPPLSDTPDATFFDAPIDSNFFDALIPGNFFDGYPNLNDDNVYAQVYKAVDRVRAGGVAFEVYVERLGCV